MAKVVYVDQEECTSCGVCMDELPEVFEYDENDLSHVHNPKGASEDKIQEVMDMCPVECIHWKE